MSFWTAIVVIVAIIAFAEVIKTRHRTRHVITTDAMGNEKHSARLLHCAMRVRERGWYDPSEFGRLRGEP